MKRKLLLLFVCLFGALGGVKAYTSVVPYVGRSYYLLNANYERYWYSIKDNGFHITDDLSAANRVTFESANGSNYAFAYYLNDTKYYLHEDDGNAKWPTSSNTMEVGATNYGYYVRNNKDGSKHRYMNAHSNEGVSFGKVEDNSVTNDKYRSWQFISVYEIDPKTPDACATAAEASYVTAANGWERVRDNATLDASLSDYFFAIVCANYPGLMVNMANGNASQQAGDKFSSSKSMWYSNSANPEVDNSFLWMIEPNTTPNYEGYTFRNASYPSLTIQTEWNTGGWGMSWYAHTNDQANPCQWNSYALIPSNGVYTIKTLANGGENYLGLWTRSNDYINGQELAGNKGAEEQGKFLIYRKLKKNVDMTGRVVNPKAESNTNGWIGFDGNVKKRNTGTGFDGASGFFELCDWGNTWDLSVYQTINNLPNGYYQIQVAGQVAADNTTMTLTANGVSNNFRATGITGGTILADGTEVASGGVAGWHYNRVLAQVTDGTLTITVHGVATSSERWGNFDNVSLTYLDGLQDLTPVSGKMNAAVDEAQQNAIETYNNNDKTIENYIAAQDAIVAAEASVASYANITAVYNECNTKATAKMTTDGQATFNESIAVTKYDEGTWETSQEATAIAAINSAYINALKQYPIDNADLTECVTNAAVSEGADWGAVTNWSSTGEGFHLNNHSTEGNTDGSGMTTPFAEAWVGSGSLGNQDITHDEITGLKNGYYRVTILTRVYNNANADMGGFKFFANDDETDLRSGATQIRWDANMRGLWKTASVVAEVTDGTLSFGFKVRNASANWLSFKTTTLTYLGETYERPVTIDFTSAIYNPSFEMDYMTAWTYNDAYDDKRTASSSMSGADGDYLFNMWDWNGKGYAISQTLSNMLPGYYSLSAVMASDNDVALRLMVGEDVVATSTATGAGNGIETSGSFYFAGGNMAISADASGSWYKVDDFRLTYVGDASAEMSVKAEAKWGTFCAPFAVDIPGGVTAYTCASATDGKLDLVEVTKGAIPANTPVILNAEEGLASTTFYGIKVPSGTGDLIVGGLLRGNVSTAVQEITDKENGYLLQKHGDKTGFYKMNTSATYRNGKNRCYLKMPAETEARAAYYMDRDDFTGINSVEAAEAESGDLKDGKYLIDGKIVIVKNGVKYGSNGQKLN